VAPVVVLPPQPATVAATAPAVRRHAAIGLDVSFIRKHYRCAEAPATGITDALHSSATVLLAELTTHMFAPSNAIACGLLPTAKVPSVAPLGPSSVTVSSSSLGDDGRAHHVGLAPGLHLHVGL
jgi:hypothetical protein